MRAGQGAAATGVAKKVLPLPTLRPPLARWEVGGGTRVCIFAPPPHPCASPGFASAPMAASPNRASYTGALLRLPKGQNMAAYFRDILIDPRTSCTRDEAVAIILGRRTFDPIYRDLNPGDDPEEVQERFMEWLDLSVFETLMDERDGILMEMDDALEEPRNQKVIDDCKARISDCDEVIRRAKRIFCDIDDEIAKGPQGLLRLDLAATEKTGQPQITLSSIRAWKEKHDYKATTIDTNRTQDAPPERTSTGGDEPLLNAKGGMSPTMTRGFLVTFAVLIEELINASGNKFLAESGNTVNLQALAEHLNKMSMPGARKGHFLKGQAVSTNELRINAAIQAAADALGTQRAKALKSKIPPAIS